MWMTFKSAVFCFYIINKQTDECYEYAHHEKQVNMASISLTVLVHSTIMCLLGGSPSKTYCRCYFFVYTLSFYKYRVAFWSAFYKNRTHFVTSILIGQRDINSYKARLFITVKLTRQFNLQCQTITCIRLKLSLWVSFVTVTFGMYVCGRFSWRCHFTTTIYIRDIKSKP